MLADERVIVDRLQTQGPKVAGQHWAALTAEALLAIAPGPLPKTFPGLLLDAERMAERAGVEDVARELYDEATRMWTRLAGVRNRPGSL